MEKKITRALVTGGSGYIASWLVLEFLQHGVEVHATARSIRHNLRLDALNKVAKQYAGRLQWFAADMQHPHAFAEAMQGCDVVFHTASPVMLAARDPQAELVDPALLGTRYVLETVQKNHTVRRVVLTSSCAAICGDNQDIRTTPHGVLTEAQWNHSASLDHNPYAYAKRVAEQYAWETMHAQDRWDLVSINPSVVMGPSVQAASQAESVHFMKKLVDGSMRHGVPSMGMGVVDVRDVALAHMRAATRLHAKGRYLVSGHNTSTLEIAALARSYLGSAYPLPSRTLPFWFFWCVGPWAVPGLTRKTVRRNVGFPWYGDHSKSLRDMGMRYRSLTQTVHDMLQRMQENDDLLIKA